MSWKIDDPRLKVDPQVLADAQARHGKLGKLTTTTAPAEQPTKQQGGLARFTQWLMSFLPSGRK